MNGYVTYLPLLAIIIPFTAAFIISLFGHRLLTIKIAVAVAATLSSLACLILLFKPIAIQGNIGIYWMGKWIPKGKLWATGLGIQVDSMGLLMALITTVLVVLLMLYAAKSMKQHYHLEKYFMLVLLFLAGMLGVVFSGDLFNMYIMIEVMSLAGSALIAFNNQLHKSIEAGFKYLIINTVGSSFILMGTVLLYAQTHTLNMSQITSLMYGQDYSQIAILALIFWLMGIGVKLIIIPCHSIWADVATAASSSASAAISGVSLCSGIYVLFRILFLVFQSQGRFQIEYLLLVWGAAAMVIGIAMSFKQEDLKRSTAFLLISEVGFIICAVGIGLSSITGISLKGSITAIYYTITYTAAGTLLLLSVGAVSYAAGTTEIRKLGGIFRKLPFTAVMFFIALAAICGIPLFSGFISKWLFYSAAMQAGFMPVAVIAFIVSIFAMIYAATIIKAVFFGKLSADNENVKEIPWLMKVQMIILSIGCAAGGILPKELFTYLIKPAVLSIYNIEHFIDVMFVDGYASKMLKEKLLLPKVDAIISGYREPMAWFLLLLAVLITLAVVLYRHINTINLQMYAIQNEKNMKDKKRIKASDKATVSTRFKSQLQWYYDGLHRVHTGSINDYVLWIVFCLAVVSVYLFAVL